MKFLEIVLNYRSGKVESHSLITKDELLKKHCYHEEIRGWSSCAREKSKYSITTSTGRFLYVRVDSYVPEDVVKYVDG